MTFILLFTAGHGFSAQQLKENVSNKFFVRLSVFEDEKVIDFNKCVRLYQKWKLKMFHFCRAVSLF